MTFNEAYSHNLSKLGLKRIRIKCDPSNKEHEGFEPYAPYEGYILQECGDMTSVYMVGVPQELSPFIDIPSIMISVIEKINKFKDFIARAGMLPTPEIAEKISNVSDLHSLESILLQEGMNVEDILSMYRSYIYNEEQ